MRVPFRRDRSYGPGRLVIVEDEDPPPGTDRPKRRPAVLVAASDALPDGWLVAELTSRPINTLRERRPALAHQEAAGITSGESYLRNRYLRLVPAEKIGRPFGWVHPEDARLIVEHYKLLPKMGTDLVVNAMLHH